LSHPFQLPRTPTAQRLTTTTLGLFRSCYAEQQPKMKMYFNKLTFVITCLLLSSLCFSTFKVELSVSLSPCVSEKNTVSSRSLLLSYVDWTLIGQIN
jgi:hypothetical protein